MTVCRTKDGARIERVARRLLGAPSGFDPEKGQERFGDVLVNLESGTFFDCEDESSGGYIELIRHVKNLHNGEAEAWFDKNITNAKPLPLPAETANERTLIGMLAMRPELMDEIETEITADHFSEIVHKQLFTAIFDAEKIAGQPISMKALMDACGGDPLMPVFEDYSLARYVAIIISEAPSPPDAEYFVRSLAIQLRSDANREGDVYDQHDVEPEPPPAPQCLSLGEWDAGDDVQVPPPRGWLLGNVFCRQFASSLLGDGGIGKSALRYAQLISLATGRQLTGEHVFQRCRVLLISLEDGVDELRRRIMAACIHHRVDRSELKGWLFLSAPGAGAGKLMANDQRGRPAVGALAAKLAHTIAARKIDIVSIDPFVKTHSVEENNNSAMDDVVQILAGLAIEHDIAVDIPHHMSKGQQEPGNANRGRGAGAVKDGCRLVYTLTSMTADEAAKLGVSDAERLQMIRMDSGKVNITVRSDKAVWHRLVGVRLNNGTALYPNGDEVQTVEPWIPPEISAGSVPAMSNDQANILNALVNALNEFGVHPPFTLQLPQSVTVVCKVDDWYNAYRKVSSKADAAFRKAMERASDKLVKEKVIGRNNPWVWLVRHSATS